MRDFINALFANTLTNPPKGKGRENVMEHVEKRHFPDTFVYMCPHCAEVIVGKGQHSQFTNIDVARSDNSNQINEYYRNLQFKFINRGRNAATRESREYALVSLSLYCKH